MSGNKVDSPCSTPKKLKFEQLRADYELFLQTFEKPTWMYRHIQRRRQLSPFMLNRNLSYLKEHGSRKKIKQQIKRKEFKLDHLIDKVPSVEETKEKLEECDSENNYLNLSFGGFFHGPGFAESIFLTNDPKIQSIYKDEFVTVSIHLIQVYHRRKKGKDAPMEIILLGTCKAPWNPRSQLLLPCSSVQLSVPPSVFAEDGRPIKTHILSITVSISVPKKMRKKRGRKKKDASSDQDNTPEPPAKRHKSETVVESSISEEGEVPSSEVFMDQTSASFSAELIVYDRHKTCLLTAGDYELLLQDNDDTCANKNNSWESTFKNKLGPFAAFSFGPTIKFSLRWESKSSVPIAPVLSSLSTPYTDSPQPLTTALASNNNKSQTDQKELPKVFYQFIYNNNTRQQTEAREGTSCPWCALNCKRLYALLKHLKCCHPRFSFLYTPLKKSHRIDVCVNDNFEGTLDFDGIKDMGFINVDDAPLHRKPQTEILVARPFKVVEDLNEFAEPDTEEIEGVVAIKGHDRVYYHGRNNQHVVHHSEFDYNSEDEKAPDWLQEKTQNMIEEFTDVNEGEKSLMKLWNLHMLKKGYIADFTVTQGCKSFVEEYGRDVIEKNMARNFLLHLNNMIEFQVISQSTVIQAMNALEKIRQSMQEE
ncbi:polycomb protein suz12-like [Hydractinia symbiolongicarpus]|uniref:polycomb protein suz12-like n=1 Tax=Hydractinia symbiolongicarpus TaxID=13093 RepID=UPI00254FBF3F|nr:polycomb protein suz12-like [Hydractinia symbiolongicarpus]